MKVNIISFIYILFLLPTFTFSQEGWFQQTSGTTNDLFDVFFIDQNNGWVVGSNGTILKTTDSGTNWISMSSGTSSNLYSVFFINQDIGWAVGQNGTILKSTDSGINWISQTSGTNNYLTSVQFTDSNNGWAVGSNVFKTTDGGLNWVPQGIGGSLNAVFFIDQNIGWIVGDQSIYKTTDGGINWSYQTGAQYIYLISVHFVDSNFGWAGGLYPIPPPAPGAILSTTDGGTNWINQPGYYFLELRSLYFTDQYTGWAVGGGVYDLGTIHNTVDGGVNWTLQYNETPYALTSVFFIDANIGWVVGYSGTILKTINGGVPVELISFTATVLQGEKAVQLNWTTATETNNQGFEILRGVYPANGGTQNDNDWEKIGFFPGFGTTTEPKSYSFVDDNVTTGIYKYRLKQIDFDGTFTYSNEIEVSVDFTPKEYMLYQNYPNPFNPATTIMFTVPSVIATPLERGKQSQLVTLKVYDVLGNEVATLVNEEKQPGVYEVEFSAKGGSASGGNASSLASGMYLYKLQAGSFVQIKKMILAK